MSDFAGDREIGDDARALLIQGCERWVQQWDHVDGVLTGFVVIVETMGTDGLPNLVWASGNGMPPENDPSVQSGLARWRIRGMCADVCSVLDAMLTRWYVRADDDD